MAFSQTRNKKHTHKISVIGALKIKSFSCETTPVQVKVGDKDRGRGRDSDSDSGRDADDHACEKKIGGFN